MIFSSSEYYDSISRSYSSISNKRKLYLESVDKLIYKNVKNKENTSFLDIGVGDGDRSNRLISKLNINKKKYFGVEPSFEMFNLANKFFHKGNLFNTSFESMKQIKQFDYIWFLWNVISHVDNLDIFFKKITSLIKKNGHIFFDFNNLYNVKEYGLKNSLINFLRSIFQKNLNFTLTNKNISTSVNFYSKNYIVRLLKKNRFKIKKIYFIDYQSGSIEGNIFNSQIMIFCQYVG